MTKNFRRGGAGALALGVAILLGGCAAYDAPGYATSYPGYQTYPQPAYPAYPAQPYYGQPAVVPGGYVGVDVYREPSPRYWGSRPVAPAAYPPGYYGGRPGWNDRDRGRDWDRDRNDRGNRGWRGAPPPQAQLPGAVPVVPVVPPRGPGAGGGGRGQGGVPFVDPRVGSGTVIPVPRQDSGNTP